MLNYGVNFFFKLESLIAGTLTRQNPMHPVFLHSFFLFLLSFFKSKCECFYPSLLHMFSLTILNGLIDINHHLTIIFAMVITD
jgi:hypothetical protein